ncbi:MAG TPA: pilus assembly protein TadG-related protein [Sphingomicrobium sp.]
MTGVLGRLARNNDGAIAPTVALSLVALIAAAGIAFDYARVASMDSELQNAADQAALAAATQLDGQTGACQRAASAASSLLTNNTMFANETGGARGVVVPTTGVADCNGNANIKFYKSYDQDADTFGDLATTDAEAHVVWISVTPREARFALTPIVAAIRSGNIGAEAIAALGSAICKTPPVMLCNPDEPKDNIDTGLAYNPARGIGLRLITGDASAPGNFGWLTAYDASGNLIDGANALKELIAYNTPPAKCQPADFVTTKPGMSASVLDAVNGRFDVYSSGASACPGGGSTTCSPAQNTRKDVVCEPDSSTTPTACKKADGSWTEPSAPYHPTSTTALPTDGTGDMGMKTMGYPKDLCHAVKKISNTCGISGNGTWDRDAYFRINYGWDHATWTAKPGLSDTMSRFDVYRWEIANPNVGGKGIGVPINAASKEEAFSQAATGRASIATPDRRRIAIAVLNCNALQAKGKETGPVATWLDSFLVEPAMQRGVNKPAEIFTDQKEVYVEVIGATSVGSANSPIVRRDVPYLIR